MSVYIENFKKILIKLKVNSKIKIKNSECILIGSGPSLDLYKLHDQFIINKDIISCNYVFMHDAYKNIRFKFYSFIDRDYTKNINNICKINSEYFIFASKNAYLLNFRQLLKKNLIILNTQPYKKEYNKNINDINLKNIYTGNSIPFLILFCILNCNYKKIYLFGIDHFDYSEFEQDNYFFNYEGRKIKSASIDKQKLDYINSFYEYVYNVAKKRGVDLINLTPNSKLKLIKNIHKGDYLSKTSPRQ